MRVFSLIMIKNRAIKVARLRRAAGGDSYIFSYCFADF